MSIGDFLTVLLFGALIGWSGASFYWSPENQGDKYIRIWKKYTKRHK